MVYDNKWQKIYEDNIREEKLSPEVTKAVSDVVSKALKKTSWIKDFKVSISAPGPTDKGKGFVVDIATTGTAQRDGAQILTSRFDTLISVDSKGKIKMHSGGGATKSIKGILNPVGKDIAAAVGGK